MDGSWHDIGVFHPSHQNLCHTLEEHESRESQETREKKHHVSIVSIPGSLLSTCRDIRPPAMVKVVRR